MHLEDKIKGIILDMDGVITQTVTLHAKAWKNMFDEFLRKKQGPEFVPLDIEKDYKQYIDGISRFDGVRNFLASRNIKLPEGKFENGPEQDTVFGLGQRKNILFLKILEQEGAQVFPDTLEMIERWKGEGKKLAVISASRNCRQILKAAGILEMFDVSVDGVTLEEENLRGKPKPDIFLRAADLLGVRPDQAIVVEDAILGVEAAKEGNFDLVVGVARNDENEALLQAGADIVVNKLTDMENVFEKSNELSNSEDLPNALLKIDDLIERMGSRKPAIFLDYDGTLTPIVSNPEDANITEAAKATLKDLSTMIPVAVISGRDRQDVKSKVGVETVIYAGSHGFDITGPNGLEMQYEAGQQILPDLDEAEKNLKERLDGIEGAQVERKKYAIAIHYRNVAEDKVQGIKNAVHEELKNHEKLKIGFGKKILELKPDLNWHKGHALTWLMDKLELKSADWLPIFIGDDVTDEDALKAVEENGIGIIVGTHDEKTSATYRLDNTDDVAQLLDNLRIRIKKLK